MKKSELLKVAKPILFNTEMVRAILSERKTHTRRLLKPQPKIENDETGVFEPMDDGTSFQMKIDGYSSIWDYPVYPKFIVGDILYVRETFIKTNVDCPKYFYKADCVPESVEHYKFTPSIHMPKDAARIFLRVTSVNVERLQAITGEQCVTEGIEAEALEVGDDFIRGMFSELWDSTVSKGDLSLYGWDANPWIVDYGFELVKVEN